MATREAGKAAGDGGDSAARRPRVALVGLGEDARALGLALQRVKTDYEIVGHDRVGERARAAVADGIVDRAEWNLFDTVEPADLIVIDEAPADLADTLESIGPHLRPGALVTDLGLVKTPVMSLAARFLPESVSFIGGHLIVEPERVARALAAARLASGGGDGDEEAAEDAAPLLGATWCLAPSPDASDEAVRVLGRMVRAVGAEALYIDPEEHDALVAGASLMPRLVTASMLRLMARSPSADDLRRLAGPDDRAALSRAGRGEAADLAGSPTVRSGLLRWLDGLDAELARLRAALRAEDGAALEALFAETAAAVEGWEGEEEVGEQAEILADLSPRNTMRRLLFGGRRREGRPPKKGG